MYFSLCQKYTIQHINVLSVSLPESRLSQKCRIIVTRHCFRKHGMHRKHGMLLWDFCPVSWPHLFAAFWVGCISNDMQPTWGFFCEDVDSTPCLSRSGFCLQSGRVSLSLFEIIEVSLWHKGVRTVQATISYFPLEYSYLKKQWCGILKGDKIL